MFYTFRWQNSHSQKLGVKNSEQIVHLTVSNWKLLNSGNAFAFEIMTSAAGNFMYEENKWMPYSGHKKVNNQANIPLMESIVEHSLENQASSV